MRTLVNTLSIGSLSGQHVVYGFLRALVERLECPSDLVILHAAGRCPPHDVLAAGVSCEAAPGGTARWTRRTAWEWRTLPKVVSRLAIDQVLSVSGGWTPRLPCRQAVLCQNPWCFVPAAQTGRRDRVKAALQRRAYGMAFRRADRMFYISDHLRTLYRNGCRGPEGASDIVHVGIDEATFAAAARLAHTPRVPLRILSVSAFARWKGVETVVAALDLLRRRNLPVTLRLVGPWPDARYRRSIEQQIRQRGLEDHVEITGKVSKAELHRNYAEASLFCLMSCCESFGIPAAEAMAFGTPVVSTDVCAIAEICRGAGAFGRPADIEWTAEAIEAILRDARRWDSCSRQARCNAARLRWSRCVEPLARWVTGESRGVTAARPPLVAETVDE